jgi:macrolide transport system ATP-binding/permease protein
MGYIRIRDRVEPEGQTIETRERLSAGKNIVSPHYFQTMGIPLAEGRAFIDTDDQQSRRVAIVNQRLADALWPGRSPIGLRFRSDAREPSIEVVGVATTGKYEYVFEDPQPYFYVPIAQEYTGLRVLQVKTRMNPDALMPSVERTIRAYEPSLPLYDVQSMSQALGSGLGFFPVRVGAVAITALGLLALALAVIGLYGVISYLTSQRTREIGIRIAIGASHTDVVRLVLENSATLVAIGLIAGVLMTLASSRLIERFLFGVSARDPLTLMTMAPLFAGLALLACTIPAWRAARLDPTVALRSE